MHKKKVGLAGLSSMGTLLISLIISGNLNIEFHFMNDFISKLGAKGQAYAIWWNIFGFIVVGLLITFMRT